MEFQLKTKKLLSKLFAGALAFTMVATSLPVTAIAAARQHLPWKASKVPKSFPMKPAPAAW